MAKPWDARKLIEDFRSILVKRFKLCDRLLDKKQTIIYKADPNNKDIFGDDILLPINNVIGASFTDGYEQLPCLFKINQWNGLSNAIIDLDNINKSYRDGCYVTQDNNGEWVILMRKELLFKFIEWQKKQEITD